MMHVIYFSTQMFCEIYFSLWAFNNYVDRILPFFDPRPLCGQFLYPERGQKQTFFDPPPHLVHVVIECPLTDNGTGMLCNLSFDIYLSIDFLGSPIICSDF